MHEDSGNPDDWAVDLSQVAHVYGKTRALAPISLRIRRGATVGLIGPDGVGKSTLLSLIAGVKVIQQGCVMVFGGDMSDKHTRNRLSHRIAFMPQGLGHNLYPTLSVLENVDFHARLFGLGGVDKKKSHQSFASSHRLIAVCRPCGGQALWRDEAKTQFVLCFGAQSTIADFG